MSDVVLRPMRWWDVEAVLPLERDLFGPSAWTAEMFWAELAHPETRWYVVAEQQVAEQQVAEQQVAEQQVAGQQVGSGVGSVIGYAGVLMPGLEADVQTLAVAGTAQGRGLGGLLVDALIGQARDRGATSLLLEVRADNEPAIGLYRSRGFEQIALRRRYYQPEDVDAIVMRLRPLTP